MTYKIFFEDADYGPIPKFLRDIAPNNFMLYFVGGSGNFRTADITSEYNADINIIYHDVIPDNTETLRSYKATCKALRMKAHTYVLPVVSLEYNLLKAFVPEQAYSIDTLIKADYSIDPTLKNLEDYLKYTLDKYENCVAIGKYNDSIDKSVYYTKDCQLSCSKHIFQATLLSKAWRLLYSLPALSPHFLSQKNLIGDLTLSIKQYNNFAYTILRERGVESGIISKNLINLQSILYYHSEK